MSRPRHAFGQQPGRLVATMLRALAAELSEPGRYSRGKGYARDGAVIEIDVRPGVVSGLVLGSGYDPYQVLLAADPVPEHELAEADPTAIRSLTMLIPGRDELAVSCTCIDADGGNLCKHAIALLLVLADETSIEPELLTRWRQSGEHDSPRAPARLAPRGRVGSPRVASPTTRPEVTAPPPPMRRVDILTGMLDAPQPIPSLPTVARVPLATPPATVLAEPAVGLLYRLTEDALAAITGRG